MDAYVATHHSTPTNEVHICRECALQVSAEFDLEPVELEDPNDAGDLHCEICGALIVSGVN